MKKKSPFSIAKILILIFVFITVLSVADGVFARSTEESAEEDICLALIVREAANKMGHPEAYNSSGAPHDLVFNERMEAGIMGYTLSASYARGFDEEYPPGTGRVGTDGVEVFWNPGDSKIWSNWRVGEWAFHLFKMYSADDGVTGLAFEGWDDDVIPIAQKYWNMYQEYGYCDENPEQNQTEPPIYEETNPGDGDGSIEEYSDDYFQLPTPALDCNGGCPGAVCQDDTSFYGDPVCENNRCFYEREEYCVNGCNDSTGYCYTLDSQRSGPSIEELLLTLLAGGAVITVGSGAVGGSILGLRALRRRQMIKARQLISQQPAPIQVTPLEKKLERNGNRIDNLLKKLNTMERAHMQHGLDHSVKMMESYHRSAATAENAETLTKGAKWVSDTGADIIGLAPGAGRYFKWAYHAGTTFIEEGIEHGISTGFYEAAGKTVMNIGGDLLGDIVPTPKIKNIHRFSGKTGVRAALKKTGMRTIGKNYAKGDVLGKILTNVNDGTSKILFGK